MGESFDFVVVGGGSAGAVIASRLSEDPTVHVALIEAGGTPPDAELMPAACGSMQLNPETDGMYSASPGNGGLGLNDRRMMAPRGKMLGGSSGLNFMAYVRGHPGDFDEWERRGATGWGYKDVLPYFKKSERLGAHPETVIDEAAHGYDGPMGVSVREPAIQGALDFVAAAERAGIPKGDYNGRGRENPNGVVSLYQTTTWQGKRTSTYRAFLQGVVEARGNLTILTHAHVVRIELESDNGAARATGVVYRDAHGAERTVRAEREVILSAGAIGSPLVLMRSGIGAREELEAAGIECRVDSPHVGKHLQDHLHCGLVCEARGASVRMSDVALALGPDALRGSNGPLPEDPAEDDALPEELKALKAEAERRVAEWAETGKGLAASSLYDAGAWVSSGLGDAHSHDIQLSCIPAGYTEEFFRVVVNMNTASYYDDAEARTNPDAETMILLANPVLPHSEGSVSLTGADPDAPPRIDMNYFSDPHDMKVMVAALRKLLDVIAHWPSERPLGPPMVPPHLAEKHGHAPGAPFPDALLEDLARHYAVTVYHACCTCRIDNVVDAELHVNGVANLRVADASVMPRIIGGNTNAACIMIGEKAAELVATEHGVKLNAMVGVPAAS